MPPSTESSRGTPFFRKAQAINGAADFEFAILQGNFVSGGKTLSQLDLYRYIMFSKTFAFPEEQQQRVINAFWKRVNGFSRDNGIALFDFDVPTAEEKAPHTCVFRPVRKPFDSAQGDHCRVGKKRDIELKAIGR
ncbi:MAG: hypothetical protein IOD12_16210 [Silvanigrellales bacterium]|jgi:hypothetical protein|nr:hypothetical protein [Silvanigrellales bacterium]